MAHRLTLALVLLGLSFVQPALGEDGPRCQLCLAAGDDRKDVPLSIEISAGIEFSRLALAGKGSDGVAALHPASGIKRVDQGFVDLGGYSLAGRARVTGAPLRAVRVVLPQSVQMRTPDGGTAELTDLGTDLPATAMLDANGVLEFAFGGRLRVPGSEAGRFRGRIPISVEYD
jgi:hypothetical protein